MRDVVVAGVGMTRFGNHLRRSMKDLAGEAIWTALADSGIPAGQIGVAYVGNALAGLITGQEGIRGETILRSNGFSDIPIVNVENACASGATALRGAWIEVASGMTDVALALGVEKLNCGDTMKTVSALSTDADLEETTGTGFRFTGLYALRLRRYMKTYNVKVEDLADVVVKNRYNGSLNPFAQFQSPVTREDVLNSRMITSPLTLYMCSPISDGAAAAILCTKEVARSYARRPMISILGCFLRSGSTILSEDGDIYAPKLAAEEAYKKTDIRPEDIDVAEVHDAMAPTELQIYESLGFCGKGEAKDLLADGRTALKGDIPVNTSGGLVARGHPVGATGVAQICEMVWQLRGEADKRQVSKAEIALAENTGGYLDGDAAACCVTLLRRL